MKHSTCQFCARPFPARSNKTYCSDRCRFAARYNRIQLAAVPCFYCGLPADTKDHVPPRSVRTYLLSQGWSATLHFYEIDACRECNAMLHDGEPYTPIGRKHKIKDMLKTRYKKYLRMPPWTEEEIREQGETFGIREALAIKEIIEKRLAW